MKDFCLDKESAFVNEEVRLIIQQIDLLFDTNEDEVLGESFGSNFYDFLWDLTVSANEISEYTKNKIESYVKLFGWNLDVHTDILQGTKNDIILIQIKLSKGSYSFEKIYKVD
jgi:hypothetical protein